jgi:hypothetical protein
LALRSGQAAQAVAKGGGVLSLAEVQHPVLIDVKACVNSKPSFVAGRLGLEGLGLDQPRGGCGAFRRPVDQRVIVHRKQEDRDQRHGLNNRRPSPMLMLGCCGFMAGLFID